MRRMNETQLNEELYRKTLANGLEVFLLPKQQMAKSYAIFMTNYGSMHNRFIPLNQKEAITVPDGIAHFLEHKLFEKEDRDVFQDFTRLGASPNAYTSFSKTAYLFSAIDHVKENVELLLDFVQDPYFSDASVEKEKGIIAQEIKMYDDQPDWRSYMGSIENMYEALPINIDIAGTVSSIYEITKEDLYTCYETFYHPKNMALFVTGNFSVEDMMAWIEANQEKKRFPDAKEIEVFYPEEKPQVKCRRQVITLPVSRPKVTIGIKERKQQFEGEELLRQELIQDFILDYFFSEAGPFYEILREEQLIDDSFNYSTTVEERFNFTLIGGHTNKAEKLEERLKQLLKKTASIEIDTASIERLRRKKIGEVLREMNSLEQIASNYLHYYFANVDYFSLLPTIQNITARDVNHYLAEWIEEDRLTTFIIEKEA